MSKEEAWPFSARAAGLTAFVVALLCFGSLSSAASVLNGDFSAGLSGWSATGDVSAVTDAALGDDGVDYSLLYEGVALSTGPYRLEFDFLNLLSSSLPSDPFAFPDMFFASLYFIDDLSTFDLASSVFDDAVGLLDLDAGGPSNVAGALSASPLGADWTHFTYDFTNSHGHVIPVFELFGFNTLRADSDVRVDNVIISQPASAIISEPASLTLSVLGLLGCAITRRRYRVRR